MGWSASTSAEWVMPNQCTAMTHRLIVSEAPPQGVLSESWTVRSCQTHFLVHRVKLRPPRRLGAREEFGGGVGDRRAPPRGPGVQLRAAARGDARRQPRLALHPRALPVRGATRAVRSARLRAHARDLRERRRPDARRPPAARDARALPGRPGGAPGALLHRRRRAEPLVLRPVQELPAEDARGCLECEEPTMQGRGWLWRAEGGARCTDWVCNSCESTEHGRFPMMLSARRCGGGGGRGMCCGCRQPPPAQAALLTSTLLHSKQTMYAG